MMNEIEMSSTRRRKSVPEIVNTVASSDDDDDVKLIDPNDIKEPEEPIYSKGRLSMEGGFAEHLRSMTPEPKTASEAFKDDLKPDGAFQDLRPKSPVYIPQYQRDFALQNAMQNSLDSSASIDEVSEDHLQEETAAENSRDDQKPDGAFMDLKPSSPKYVPKYQRYGSQGDSVDQDETSEVSYPADCEISNLSQESRSPHFKLVRSDSNSGRMLVKIPLDPKLADIDEDVLFDRSTDETTNDSDTLSLPSYPVSMTTFNRGVSPSGQMNLALPKQQTLSTLRARLKIDFGKDIHNTIDLLKSKVSNVYERQQSVDVDDESTVQPDLMDIMDERGNIIWDREDDEKDIEEVLGFSIAEMPTMKPKEFQNIDPSNIIDTYLTKDYIIIETSS